MTNGALPRLHELGALPDVQQSTQLLTQLLGVKAVRGLKFSPTIVPGLDAVDLMLQSISEVIAAETDINAAGGTAAGSAYTLYTVPDTEVWRYLDGSLSSDVLDADQNASLQGIYSNEPFTAGIPNGVLRAGNVFSLAASQLKCPDLIGQPEIWIRPGGRIGFVLVAPAVVGVALNIRINARIRIARLRV